jgi:proline iminopeptidase
MTTQEQRLTTPSLPTAAAPSARSGIAMFGGVAALAFFALLTTLGMPRGPVTDMQVWGVLLGALGIGFLGGLTLHTRWAMLLLPVVYVAVVELARLNVVGPTVDALRLDNPYGILALLVGRGFHGLIVFPPLLLGVGLGLTWVRATERRASFAHAVLHQPLVMILVLLVAGLAVLNLLPASTPPILDAAGQPIPGSIAELTTVRLGGREQAIMVRGRSADLPVLLYLSGGPGQSDLPYVRVLFEDLTQHFIVVGWDQRGTGKSYAALDPTDELTLAQAVADTIELSTYLRERFGEEKIYLLGESWGTTLGVLAVQQRPDLYHAWIGSGQMVSQRATDRQLYHDVLALAGRTGDRTLRDQMLAFGEPPYADIPYPNAIVMGNYPRLETPYTPPRAYIERGTAANLGPYGIFASEYSFVEKANVLRGLIDMFTVMYPQLQEIDFRRDVRRLDVPVYLLDGAAELPARRDLALAWYEQLDAPLKRLYTFENGGHSVAFEQYEALQQILAETVLAETQPVHGSVPALPTPAAFAAFFDAALPEQLAAEGIAGAAAAVVHKGELVFAQGYGAADVDAGIPVTADRTLFFIGSVGKLLTWSAVMQLVEEGKLDLHVDVNRYLDFALPAAFDQPITLHHLMTHSAGFEEEFNSLFVADEAHLLPLREHLLRFMPARVYAPGAVMAYSNYGTALAGYVVERVAGQPFAAYLTEHLLQPLGMTHSFVGNAAPPALVADLAQGYRRQNGAFIGADFEWAAAAPTAPLRTTATDISRFLAAHLGKGCVDGACILRPETVAAMHATHFTHPLQTDGMAYGFMATTINGERVLWHLGGSPHFVTMLALVPAQELGFVVAYNTPPADDGRAMLFRLMDEFFPATRTTPPAAPLPGADARAALFNGAYAPARSNHTTAQKLIRYLETAPIALEAGRLTFNNWRFVETEPGVMQQVDGDRRLTFYEDAHGQRWFFVGVLAYFQVPWYETLWVVLAGGAGYVLVLGSLVANWALRRKQDTAPSWRAIVLVAGLGLFSLGLFGWLAAVLLAYGGTLVYPQATVELISRLFWLAAPWTAAVVGYAVAAWLRCAWNVGWRLHYTLAAGFAALFLWFIWQINLLPG